MQQKNLVFYDISSGVRHYKGPLKVICSPGLTCYSCPASTTYCSIGSLQQLLLSIRFSLRNGHYYFGTFVLGSIGLLGAAFRRFICGRACPFGLFQELLHKNPSVKYSIPKKLNWFKYGFLVLFVVILPLVLLQPGLKKTIGWLYLNKMMILVIFIFWSVVASSPFCRTTCPRGAFCSLFNRYRLIKLKFNEENCIPKARPAIRYAPWKYGLTKLRTAAKGISCMKGMTQACNFNAISIEN